MHFQNWYHFPRHIQIEKNESKITNFATLIINF